MSLARSVVHVAVAVALVLVSLGLQLPSSAFGEQTASQQGRTLESALAQTPQTPLPGHVPGILAQATPVLGPAAATAGGADGGQPITFSVVLRRTDEAGFQTYLQSLSDPRSPNFRRFITPAAEVARRFGPSQEAYDAVRRFLLQESGLTLVRDAPDRLMITVQGSRDQVNRALGAQIRTFQWQGEIAFSNSVDPVVPSGIAPYILSIVGLNNFGRARPASSPAAAPSGEPAESLLPDGAAAAPGDADATRASRVEQSTDAARDTALLGGLGRLAAAGAPPVPLAQATATPRPRSLTVMEVARAYNAQGVLLPSGTPATGAGQTIGLVEYGSFNSTDVANWLASTAGPCAGQGVSSPCVQSYMSRLLVTTIGGDATRTATPIPTPHPGAGSQGEALLDIAAVMGIAPGANYAVYEAANTNDNRAFNNFMLMMLNEMSTKTNVISSSWSLCENTATLADTIAFASVIQQAALQGVNTFFAVNDTGNACNGDVSLTDQTTYPTGAPYTIAVGGSILTVGQNGEYYQETWWGSGMATPHECVIAFNSGGGSPPPNPNNGGCGGFGQSKLYTPGP